ncbi:MAG: energy transducer TonB [Leptospiraceae bacterium]|nr:energy transducer TonB [Leptospiraceae bacterium]
MQNKMEPQYQSENAPVQASMMHPAAGAASASLLMRPLVGFRSLSAGSWEDRMLLAGAAVFFLFASLVSFFITEERDSMVLDFMERELLRPALNLSSSMVYPVLLEQDYAAPVKQNEKAALSDVNAGGSGGLTERYGFHTLSQDDVLQVSYGSATPGGESRAAPGGGGPAGRSNGETGQNATGPQNFTGYESGEGPGASPDAIQDRPNNSANQNQQRNQNNAADSGNAARSSTAQQGQSDQVIESLPMRIPANYRFQNDFSLRYDQSASLSIPRRELEGYKYFRDLLRQVRSNFAPPGLNLAYRDSAGVVISQPIKPQVVRVLFLIDEEGTVRDTRVVSSMGQQPVDQACVRSLEGHNFGKPPPEIFKHGNIFGISFVFPAVMNR